MMIILFLAAWFCTGIGSFLFWWTKQIDFQYRHIGTAMCGTIMGPLAFFVGWLIHGDSILPKDRIILKKRQ